MIKKIVFDGHDGVGKSTRIEKLKELFHGIEFSDRGIFSEATMNEKLFPNDGNSEDEVLFERGKFYEKIKSSTDTLYIILDASPEECQRRILERGGSIDCEFHNMHDLVMYRKRFKELVELVAELPNVMYASTEM